MRLLTLTLLVSAAASAQQPQQPPTGLARLESNIQRITRSVNATWGIYIKCLETGDEIAINADRQMDTMSVIKIPLMVEAFRQIEAGKFGLSDKITLTEAAKRPGTGVIRSLDPGAVLTIKDLLTLMIIVSDNTATDLMYDKVGGVEPVNGLMTEWGLNSIHAPGTADAWFKALRAAPSAEAFHREAKSPFGLSSPRDMGKLLERIEKGEAVSKKASDTMLQIMRGQVYSSRLPRFVTGYRLPHKTGDFMPYIGNDVGILENQQRHIVISVFTANHFGVGDALEEAIGRIAELTGNYFAR
jgi:beta-lactamase class A